MKGKNGYGEEKGGVGVYCGNEVRENVEKIEVVGWYVSVRRSVCVEVYVCVCV